VDDRPASGGKLYDDIVRGIGPSEDRGRVAMQGVTGSDLGDQFVA
jgi:hypothetical protein